VTAAPSHPAYHDPAVIERILADSSVWAVVGLGNDPRRAAYPVAEFLQKHGKRIVPVHPRADEVLGETVYRTLAEIPFPVDVVDIFRRSDVAGRSVDEAIAIRVSAVWLQLGVIDARAAERAKKAGLDVVMDTCPKIEWPAHGPRSEASS
jgi:predicted CoA-binding protein